MKQHSKLYLKLVISIFPFHTRELSKSSLSNLCLMGEFAMHFRQVTFSVIFVSNLAIVNFRECSYF